ncbi:MAG: HlyD family type I secretion periplasmic adaptor subunit, partial [Pseudomonadota bacterium]
MKLRGALAAGCVAIGLLGAGLGGWATQVEIAGAILAPGVVEVEAERQVVQHPDGGVVGAILARDGDRVQAGDILVRIDGTFLASERDLIDRQLFEIAARRARLQAIRDDAAAPDFVA